LKVIALLGHEKVGGGGGRGKIIDNSRVICPSIENYATVMSTLSFKVKLATKILAVGVVISGQQETCIA